MSPSDSNHKVCTGWSMLVYFEEERNAFVWVQYVCFYQQKYADVETYTPNKGTFSDLTCKYAGSPFFFFLISVNYFYISWKSVYFLTVQNTWNPFTKQIGYSFKCTSTLKCYFTAEVLAFCCHKLKHRQLQVEFHVWTGLFSNTNFGSSVWQQKQGKVGTSQSSNGFYNVKETVENLKIPLSIWALHFHISYRECAWTPVGKCVPQIEAESSNVKGFISSFIIACTNLFSHITSATSSTAQESLAFCFKMGQFLSANQ